jgi:serine/threonine-protein kinase HipA
LLHLDPEGIPRSCRWDADQETAGIPNWGKVVEALPGDINVEYMRNELATLGERIEKLPDIMKECGVDADIITYRIKSIERNSKELIKLQ